MIAYSGNGRRPQYVRWLRENGFGQMLSAYDWQPPSDGIRWAFDNGAFSAFLRGEPFDVERFARAIFRAQRLHAPDFAVLPDIVAGGLRSLAFSRSWIDHLPAWPWYLAVQDGMDPIHLRRTRTRVDGIFVGGTMEWKLATGERWVQYAHRHGLKCHIGRVGTLENIQWALRIGADSIDSTSWARHDTHHLLETALLHHGRPTRGNPRAGPKLA